MSSISSCRGHNYGWPLITYGTDYTGRPIGNGERVKPGLEQPVHYWAPISVAPVRPRARAQSFATHRVDQHARGETLLRLTFGDGCTVSEEHFLEHRLGRLRDVRIDPSGVLYVLTDGQEGMLYRLNRPAGEDTATRPTSSDQVSA